MLALSAYLRRLTPFIRSPDNMCSLNCMKKNRYKCIFVIIFAMGTAFAGNQDTPRPAVGQAIETEGKATAVFDYVTRDLSRGSPVLFEDTVRTAPNSRLSVVLTDGSNITLGENASVVIDDFVYKPDTSIGTLVLRALHGAFLFAGGKIENIPNAEVSIFTPAATLGIRGTKVWAGPIDSQYGVLTLEGEVVVSNSLGSVTLGVGQGTMISDASPPSQPVDWSSEKVQRALNATLFSQ